MDPAAVIGRDAEVAHLIEACAGGGAIVEVVAGNGMGKTTLVKRASVEFNKRFGGVTELFIGSASYPLANVIDLLADRFRSAEGTSLLIIEEAYQLDPGDILESVNRLGTGPWSFSTILTTPMPLGLGSTSIELAPLKGVPFITAMEAALGLPISKLDAKALQRTTWGRPDYLQFLAEQWSKGQVSTVKSLGKLLGPLNVPGLLGPDGQPARPGGDHEHKLITDVRVMNDELLKTLSQNPELIYQMPSRRFEELIAELLHRGGYDVKLTPQTRDGGKDIYAAKSDQFGSFLFLVECKRFAPDNPVGVEIIRGLHGVAQHERATAAMLMTTSYFTEPARAFVREVRYQLSLNDFVDLKKWLANVKFN